MAMSIINVGVPTDFTSSFKSFDSPYTGADPGGGGSWGSGPPPFGGPPNFIKKEKNVTRVRAKDSAF